MWKNIQKYIVTVKFWVKTFIWKNHIVQFINWIVRLIKVNRDYYIIENKITKGIPIIVLDLKTNKLFEYRSIAEAARSFNVYPNKIWRTIRKNKPYLNRYQIEYKSYININETIIYNLLFALYVKCFKYIFKRKNIILIIYIILFIILGFILCKYIPNIILILKDMYNNYIYTMNEIRINHLRYISEHKFLLCKNSSIENIKGFMITDQINKLTLFNKEFGFIHMDTYKSIDTKLSIYQSIMNEINLNFNNNYLDVSSFNSSPIIERIDINNVFDRLIKDTTSVVETINNNSLSITNNRNSLTLNTSINLLTNKSGNKELLNYQSNILYLLVNGLSPSLY